VDNPDTDNRPADNPVDNRDTDNPAAVSLVVSDNLPVVSLDMDNRADSPDTDNRRADSLVVSDNRRADNRDTDNRRDSRDTDSPRDNRDTDNRRDSRAASDNSPATRKHRIRMELRKQICPDRSTTWRASCRSRHPERSLASR
jgi:hypothetical protein